MKFIKNLKKGSRTMWHTLSLSAKTVILSTFILTGIQQSLQAQTDTYTAPSWWFGVVGAANLNFFNGSTQELNYDLTVPTVFHKGFGVGAYAAPLISYHRPNTTLGASLQVGFDGRNGTFAKVNTPCNCPAELSTKLSYITIEPSLTISPFKSGLYLNVGPRLAFNLNNKFKYKQEINPLFPGQQAIPEVKGELNKLDYTKVSMQVGAGYDIRISPKNKEMQTIIAPFVTFIPYFGQSPRLIESWNITTVRVGAALKFGRGHKNTVSTPAPATAEVMVPDTKVVFTVNAPKNIPTERKVREIFPLRNYIFFNAGSTTIPDRYELLNKSQVKDFKEDQLELFTPKNMVGRAVRQMIVYYNVINIIGDRLGKNPTATINLVGSSEQGATDGRAMAESVKQYLVNIFSINGSRISTEGRVKPVIPSEKAGATRELDLLRDGDRRVSIESNSAAMLTEFQNGPDAQLRPVEINAMQVAPIDSYVSFTVKGAAQAFSSWSLDIADESGRTKHFGPYTQEKVSIPGKSIMGTNPEGNYKVTMNGMTNNGKMVKKETTVHMVLWTPSTVQEGMRYSVLFEFNESKTIKLYEKYLTDIVVAKIPVGANVIIHGHTDIIGEDDYNQKLSMARANEVKTIMQAALAKTGRTDVTFEVFGFGEDEILSPFENEFPEERFYNRTVVIDIIPTK